jgi:hypothetical protein
MKEVVVVNLHIFHSTPSQRVGKRREGGVLE